MTGVGKTAVSVESCVSVKVPMESIWKKTDGAFRNLQDCIVGVEGRGERRLLVAVEHPEPKDGAGVLPLIVTGIATDIEDVCGKVRDDIEEGDRPKTKSETDEDTGTFSRMRAEIRKPA